MLSKTLLVGLVCPSYFRLSRQPDSVYLSSSLPLFFLLGTYDAAHNTADDSKNHFALHWDLIYYSQKYSQVYVIKLYYMYSQGLFCRACMYTFHTLWTPYLDEVKITFSLLHFHWLDSTTSTPFQAPLGISPTGMMITLQQTPQRWKFVPNCQRIKIIKVCLKAI